MKIAILMSTYNGEKYLNQQLYSIYKQTIKENIVLYIRDDGSKDKTLDIIKKWSRKLEIHLNKGTNKGPAESFWGLIKDDKIEADYFAFCDQDDVWDTNKLERGVICLKNSGKSLYYSNCRIIDKDGIILKKSQNSQEPKSNIENLFVRGVVQGCAMIITKEYREYLKKSKITSLPMHDLIIHMYASIKNSIVYDEKPRFSYRIHESNVSVKSGKNIIKKIFTTYRNWKNSSKNSLEIVAKEILENEPNIENEFIKKMS